MIKVENIEVAHFQAAIRGMRNPLESWGLSDSEGTVLGPKDSELALKLIKAGTDHSKFLRQITISMDITSSMSWWVEMDTYKVATVRNSTSRMHKLGSRLLTADDFSWDDEEGNVTLSKLRILVLTDLNSRIMEWQVTKDADLWRSIILDLPASYNYRSTWSGSYQVLRSIYHARKNHKQKEFRDFCRVLEALPYSEFITI